MKTSMLILAIGLFVASLAPSASAQCTCVGGSNAGNPCMSGFDCSGPNPGFGTCLCPDHLKCYAIQDPLPPKTYTFDLNAKQSFIFPPELGDQHPVGLPVVPGCRIKTPAKFFCIDVEKTNAHEVLQGGGIGPPPPGAPKGPDPGDRLCYKLKCPPTPDKVVTVQDQFGTRAITAPVHGKTVWLCTPAYKQLGT